MSYAVAFGSVGRGQSASGDGAYEGACALDPTDARVFFELDQLRKRLGEPNERRRALMEQHGDLVEQRYDLQVEKVALPNLLGRHHDALEILLARRFHPWEGGEGKVTAQLLANLVESTKHLIFTCFRDTLVHVEETMEKQNITLSIPKETLLKAKLLAVRRQTSVSALLTETLERLVRQHDAYTHARQRHLQWLEQGVDLGTNGDILTGRDELHERA